jgi:hypothetical protein
MVGDADVPHSCQIATRTLALCQRRDPTELSVPIAALILPHLRQRDDRRDAVSDTRHWIRHRTHCQDEEGAGTH